jgi:hypothetical protein
LLSIIESLQFPAFGPFLALYKGMTLIHYSRFKHVPTKSESKKKKIGVIMKKTIIIGMFMLMAIYAAFATTVTFDDPSDLTSLFTPDSDPQFIPDATHGLNGSGCVDLYTNRISWGIYWDTWTVNEGMAAPGVGQTAVIDCFVNTDSQGGYTGLGFSTSPVNEAQGVSSNGLIVTPGADFLAMNFHGNGGSLYSNSTVSLLSYGSDYPVISWLHVYYRITNNGFGNYTTVLEIRTSNSSGADLGYLRGSTRSFTNTGFAAASTIYPCFYNIGWRTAYMDNFSYTIEGVADPVPGVATNPTPADGASDIPTYQTYSWSAPTGTAPTGYKLNFGTDNPPTNWLHNADLGNSLSTYHIYALALAYNQVYYWQVIPYNGAGDATDAPVWSFTTTDTAHSYTTDLPTDGDPISPEVYVHGLSGSVYPYFNYFWNPSLESMPGNVGLAIQLSNANFDNKQIEIIPDLGYIPSQLGYRRLPELSWTFIDQDASWLDGTISIVLESGLKDAGDYDIIFPNTDGGTLPVTLTSFAANALTYQNGEQYVRIAWSVESETGITGYNLFRSETASLSDVLRINNTLITATNESSSHSYRMDDTEVYAGTTLSYWLESIAIDGTSNFYGPATVVVSDDSHEGETPDLLPVTSLNSVYPNPFNPSTSISFSLREESNVRIRVFDVRGRLVSELTNNVYAADKNHTITWEGMDYSGRSCSSGIYFIRMDADGFTATRKAVLVK